MLALAGIVGLKTSDSKAKGNPKKQAEPMMQHNVYFWLKSGVSDSEKKAFEQGLRDLITKIKEVHKAEIGVPAKTEDRDVVDLSFGYSLFTWFKSIKDHDIYQEHPVHKKFIENHSSIWEKVIVYDSNLI